MDESVGAWWRRDAACGRTAQRRGPFPAILLLHGTHGFAHQYVRLAEDLARGGVLAVAACWFSGGSGGGLQFITPIGCPDAPPVTVPTSPDAMQRVATLLRAVRLLPDVRPDRVAIFGHSRGGGAASQDLPTASDLRAVGPSSTGYPSELTSRAAQITTPILIFHGARNDPADGGSALSNIQMARDFDAARRHAGRPVEFGARRAGCSQLRFLRSCSVQGCGPENAGVPTAAS